MSWISTGEQIDLKYKYYLRGVGIGLIVGVIIMAIAIKLNNSTISDAEIINRAQELGMVYLSDDTENDFGASSGISTEEDENISFSDDTGSKNTDSETTETEEDEAKDTDKGGNKSDSKSSDKNNAKNNAEDGTDGDLADGDEVDSLPTDTTTVEISGSDYSDAVARKLEKAGVIDDADDFNTYLIENGYDSLIQPGSIEIPQNASYEEIAQLLLTKNSER